MFRVHRGGLLLRSGGQDGHAGLLTRDHVRHVEVVERRLLQLAAQHLLVQVGQLPLEALPRGL